MLGRGPEWRDKVGAAQSGARGDSAQPGGFPDGACYGSAMPDVSLALPIVCFAVTRAFDSRH